MAVIAGMYNAALAAVRPPRIWRAPCFLPESQAKGASPASALICLLLSRPSSGSAMSRLFALLSPMPVKLLSNANLQLEIAVQAELNRSL